MGREPWLETRRLLPFLPSLIALLRCGSDLSDNPLTFVLRDTLTDIVSVTHLCVSSLGSLPSCDLVWKTHFKEDL